MRRLLARTGLATRLVVVLVVLIVLTTLSAGVPAYLLARSQLEQQAWQQVDATQRATESLYEASLGRVIDLTALLAERPTLRALVTDRDTAALESYLNGFMEQSDLDLSQLCDEDGAWITTGISLDLCAIAPDGGIVLVEGQPLMLARQAIRLEDSPETLGTVLSGLRLDAEFLAGLSANTGVDFAYLARNAQVNAAGMAVLALAPPPPEVRQNMLSRQPSGYDARLRWEASPGAAGYKVFWRDAWAPDWQHELYVGNVTEFVFPNKNIDDHVFGVAAVDAAGHESTISAYVMAPRNND